MIKNSAKNRYVLQFYYGKITNAALAHKKVGALSPHKGSERPLWGERAQSYLCYLRSKNFTAKNTSSSG